MQRKQLYPLQAVLDYDNRAQPRTPSQMRYIDFELVEEKPKTGIYHVYSKESGDYLGKIYWYAPWRQYVFAPQKETFWSMGCIEQVSVFLDDLMTKRPHKK